MGAPLPEEAVTDAMIEAGWQALTRAVRSNGVSVPVAVYRAMRAATQPTAMPEAVTSAASDPPLLSERRQIAGADHAPGSAARDGSEAGEFGMERAATVAVLVEHGIDEDEAKRIADSAMPEEEVMRRALVLAIDALGWVNTRCFDDPRSPLKPIGDIAREALQAVCKVVGDDAYDNLAEAALSTPIPLKPKVDEDAGWVPSIGERVVVTSTKEWASDWVDAAGQPLQLWVAGVQAMAGGGFNVTVADETQWPLKPSAPFSGAGLTDGFIVGRPDEQDDLAPEHIAARLEDGK